MSRARGSQGSAQSPPSCGALENQRVIEITFVRAMIIELFLCFLMTWLS